MSRHWGRLNRWLPRWTGAGAHDREERPKEMSWGRWTRGPVITWRESDNDDRVMCCGVVRPCPREPQIAGEVQVGHQEKKNFLGKWYRSGSGAWGGGGGITIPGGVKTLGWAEPWLIWPSAGNSPLSRKMGEITSRSSFQPKSLWFYDAYWAAASFLNKLWAWVTAFWSQPSERPSFDLTETWIRH